MADESVDRARARLIEFGGITSQDLGLGRILGQVLVYLYLSTEERSLDEMALDLQLSKAAVSIAGRQLETMGLLRRVWRAGDRRTYYRTADDIASALQTGLMTFLKQKLDMAGKELSAVEEILKAADEKDAEVAFVKSRVARAAQLEKRVSDLVHNPLLKLLSGLR